jgi:hypothetical protein
MSRANQAKTVQFAIPQRSAIVRANVIDAMHYPVGCFDEHHKTTV